MLHRGTRNPRLHFDHWSCVRWTYVAAHIALTRDGLETGFVAMIPLYRHVIETLACTPTRGRFNDKRHVVSHRISFTGPMFSCHPKQKLLDFPHSFTPCGTPFDHVTKKIFFIISFNIDERMKIISLTIASQR